MCMCVCVCLHVCKYVSVCLLMLMCRPTMCVFMFKVCSFVIVNVDMFVCMCVRLCIARRLGSEPHIDSQADRESCLLTSHFYVHIPAAKFKADITSGGKKNLG